MKRILPLLLLILIASCSSYTIRAGKDSITLPVYENLPETRYRVIKAAKDAEEARIQAELDRIRLEEEEAERLLLEAERKAEEERARLEEERLRLEEEERIRAEQLAIEMAVNEYPEDLSELAFPHIYRPRKDDSIKEGSILKASVLLLPLGSDDKADDTLQRIQKSVSDIEADFIVLLGSLHNQARYAMLSERDAVTLEGGTVIHSLKLESADSAKAVFRISEDRTVDITPVYLERLIPETADEIPQWLGTIDYSAMIPDIGQGEDKPSMIVLSSSMPATGDWSKMTPYWYRDDFSFPVSDAIESKGYLDVYRMTHYTSDVDPGITRKTGDVYERLDFIYAYGMMPLSSMTMPVMGLTDTEGTFALYGESVLP